MKTRYTHRGNMQEIVNAVNQNKCHSRNSLSGIFNACRGKKQTCPEGFLLRTFHACRSKNKEENLFNNNRCVGDPRVLRTAISGMTPHFINGGCIARGFTLIEVLVVVLIIGILAAVALPQYQKAVRKSRFASLMPIGKTLANANEAYYLANSMYATTPANLPVEGRSVYPDGTSIEFVNNDNYNYTIVYNETNLPDNNYIVFQKHSAQFADTTLCEARNDTAAEVCRALGGTDLGGGITNGFTAYLLSGNSTGSFAPEPPQHTSGTGGYHFTSDDCYHAQLGCNTYTYGDGTVVETWEDENGIDAYETDGVRGTLKHYTLWEPCSDDNACFSDFCQKYPGIETVGNHTCAELL